MTDTQTSDPGAIAPQKPKGDLIYRQKIATRITHWIWAICFLFLVPTGLQIFNAHPTLYVGKESGFEYSNAILQIGREFQTNQDTGERELRGITEIRGLGKIDTTGILGVSQRTTKTDDGSVTRTDRRAFPYWATLPAGQSLALGRNIHLFYGWVLVGSLLVWLAFSIFNGHAKKDLLPTKKDMKNFRKDLNDHAKFKFHHTRDYNVLQKLSYFVVLFILFPLIILTGLSMSPSANAAMPWLLDIFGGRQTARTLHFVAMLGLVGFFVIHIFMVIAAGPLNNLRSMITGWYRTSPAPVADQKDK